MKTNKFICLLFLIIIILITNACNTNKPEISFVESSFPLKQKWGFDTGKRINSLAVSNHWVVLGTIDGIVALDSNTGQLLWTSDYLVDPESPIIITEEYLIASNSKQISMVSDIGQHLLTIDLSSNQEDAEVISSYSNYIFILRRPSWILEAYNLVDGSRVWDLSVGPGGLDINFDTLTRIVYITTMESVRALEISSGKLLWEFSQKVITSTYNSGILYFVAETDNPDIKNFSFAKNGE